MYSCYNTAALNSMAILYVSTRMKAAGLIDEGCGAGWAIEVLDGQKPHVVFAIRLGLQGPRLRRRMVTVQEVRDFVRYTLCFTDFELTVKTSRDGSYDMASVFVELPELKSL